MMNIRMRRCFLQLHAKEFRNLVDRDATPQHHGAARFANHVGRGTPVFFADFADDLLDQRVARPCATGKPSNHYLVRSMTTAILLILHYPATPSATPSRTSAPVRKPPDATTRSPCDATLPVPPPHARLMLARRQFP